MWRGGRPVQARHRDRGSRHGYTFNVGGWVASDYHSGAGQAGAQAFMEGFVLALTVWQ
ncbi:hypothetical protein [Streptomyces sp. NPDC046385]|uniref:hypothetical protein n=1 Tax=unclassified Streptomyces TaxID=2593676 RepID=UPI0033FACEA4